MHDSVIICSKTQANHSYAETICFKSFESQVISVSFVRNMDHMSTIKIKMIYDVHKTTFWHGAPWQDEAPRSGNNREPAWLVLHLSDSMFSIYFAMQ